MTLARTLLLLLVASLALNGILLRSRWEAQGRAEVAVQQAERDRDRALDIEQERQALEAQAVQARAIIEAERARAVAAESLARRRQAEAAERVRVESVALRATLDSAQTVAHDALEAAHAEEKTALVAETEAVRGQLAAADSLAVIERARYAALFRGYEARGGAIASYEIALEAALRTPKGRSVWVDRAVTALATIGADQLVRALVP